MRTLADRQRGLLLLPGSSRQLDLERIRHAQHGPQRVYLGTPEHELILRHSNVPAAMWRSLTPRQRWVWLTEYLPLLIECEGQ